MSRRRPHAPLITGHRGAAAVAPENTVAGIRRGIADGADQLECDVHLTRAELDGVLVGEGEHVPTLAQVLDAAVREDGTRAPLLVEISAPAAAALAARILTDAVEASDWSSDRPAPARIISFHADALRIALDKAPDVPRGLLATELSDEVLDDAMGTKAEILGIRLSDVRDGDLERIRGVGLTPSVGHGAPASERFTRCDPVHR